jgi:2-oxoisovalerate dehydrogenase E1 component
MAMTPTTMERASFPKLDLLRTMMLSREGDRREGILMRQGKGWFQVPGMGHEALAAIAYHLRPDDYIFPTYRDRALMLARGMTTREIALDFMARAGSSSDGRNMPAHYSSRALNVFSVATPTGSQCLPAVGAAWGIKLAGDDRVVVCSIGDAATRQGEFYEAVCYAIQESLPIVFVVEDNQYGISTPTRHMLPMRLHVFDEQWVVYVNGRRADEVYEKAGEAIRKARTGGGPTILWCEIDRLSSHTSADDHRVYRPAEEIEAMFERDPIRLLAEQLIAEGALTQAQYEQMQADITREVDAIYQEVERVPLPDPAHVLDHLYGEPPAHYKPMPLAVESEPTTMVAAFNRTFHAAMETFDNIVVFGEDIEDPKGGVFGFTKGLSSKYPERVRNSPLAEATIVGTAVGLAAMGYRPRVRDSVHRLHHARLPPTGLADRHPALAQQGRVEVPAGHLLAVWGVPARRRDVAQPEQRRLVGAHARHPRRHPQHTRRPRGAVLGSHPRRRPDAAADSQAHLPRAHACAGVSRHPVRQGSHPPRRDGCHGRCVGEHAGVGVPSRRAVRAAGRLAGDYRPAHAGAVRLGDR